jgi:hypothetical protein
MDAVELRPGDIEPPRLGAGRQQQAVELEFPPAFRFHASLRGVQLAHRLTRQQLDRVLAVEAFVVDVSLLTLGLASQVVLAQRRAFIGPFRLGADQHHTAVEALVAKLLGRLGAGEARAHDHKCLIAHHVSPVTRVIRIPRRPQAPRRNVRRLS